MALHHFTLNFSNASLVIYNAAMTLPKLNLRDLLWLVVVVALSIGWWADRVKLQKQIATRERSEALLVDRLRAHLSVAELTDTIQRLGGGTSQGSTVRVKAILEGKSPPAGSSPFDSDH